MKKQQPEDGYTKAQRVAAKIRGDVDADKRSAVQAAVQAESALQQMDSEMLKMYSENALLGAENIVGSTPLLKIHTTNKSQGNVLDNGDEPGNGWFYYKPTRQAFEEVDCHILTISKGFRAEGLEGKQDVFNQIVGGMLDANGEVLPFLMYFTGVKLSRLWEFGREVNPYTHMKPQPIPMFALKVKLTTVKEAHKYGESWVVNFQIQKNENGFPDLIMDPGKFLFLRESVTYLQEMIDSLIASKASEDTSLAGEPVVASEPPHPGEATAAAEVFGQEEKPY